MSLMPESMGTIADQKILSLIQDHVRKIGEQIRELISAIDKFSNHSKEDAKIIYSRLRKLDLEAEELKKQLYEYISRVGLGMVYREDWVRLAINLDSMSDYIISAAYRIYLSSEREIFPPAEVIYDLKKLAEGVLFTYDALRDSIFAYSVNVKRAVELCDKIDIEEEKVDEIRRVLDLKIAESNIPIVAILQLRDIVYAMENAVDYMKRAGDDLRIIALHRIG
ncbi:MAG: DUF47 family protein [Candidatus Methanomethylicia archaeon]